VSRGIPHFVNMAGRTSAARWRRGPQSLHRRRQGPVDGQSPCPRNRSGDAGKRKSIAMHTSASSRSPGISEVTHHRVCDETINMTTLATWLAATHFGHESRLKPRHDARVEKPFRPTSVQSPALAISSQKTAGVVATCSVVAGNWPSKSVFVIIARQHPATPSTKAALSPGPQQNQRRILPRPVGRPKSARCPSSPGHRAASQAHRPRVRGRRRNSPVLAASIRHGTVKLRPGRQRVIRDTLDARADRALRRIACRITIHPRPKLRGSFFPPEMAPT